MKMDNFVFYALKRDNNIVYIGRTNNLKRRMYQHKSENVKDYDSYEILHEFKCDLVRAYRVEDYLIKKHDPQYNKALNYSGAYVSFEDILNEVGKDKELLVEMIMDDFRINPVFKENYKAFDLEAIKQALKIGYEF